MDTRKQDRKTDLNYILNLNGIIKLCTSSDWSLWQLPDPGAWKSDHLGPLSALRNSYGNTYYRVWDRYTGRQGNSRSRCVVRPGCNNCLRSASLCLRSLCQLYTLYLCKPSRYCSLFLNNKPTMETKSWNTYERTIYKHETTLIKLKSEEKYFSLYDCDEFSFLIVDRCILAGTLLNFLLTMHLFSVSASYTQLHFLCPQTLNIGFVTFFPTFNLFLQSLGKTDIISFKLDSFKNN